jgi:hypothetical protein
MQKKDEENAGFGTTKKMQKYKKIIFEFEILEVSMHVFKKLIKKLQLRFFLVSRES